MYSVIHRLHRSSGQAAREAPRVADTGGDGGAVLCDPALLFGAGGPVAVVRKCFRRCAGRINVSALAKYGDGQSITNILKNQDSID